MYEIYTDGMSYRIKKHYTNWRGKPTWKWVTSGGLFDNRPIETLGINTIQTELNVLIKMDEAKKHGWKKVEEK